MGFPHSSAGKESACNAGDPSLIPGSGRSAGEGIGYPLQYSWTSLVAQLVKNLPKCRRPEFDPWVGKIPLEKGKATHSSILALRIPWSQSQTRLSNFDFQRWEREEDKRPREDMKKSCDFSQTPGAARSAVLREGLCQGRKQAVPLNINKSPSQATGVCLY